jgi:protein arginine kinase activator
MQCQQCGEREAVIHLTQIADQQVTVVHLCERCAAERGFDTGAAAAKSPLGSFLATLSGLTDPEELAGQAPDRCPTCGGTFEDFKASGRLGCADCYRTFAAPLRDLMRRLHGATTHQGERYRPAAEGESPQPEPDEEELQAQLRQAIADEDFERAAELRDRLRGPRA